MLSTYLSNEQQNDESALSQISQQQQQLHQQSVAKSNRDHKSTQRRQIPVHLLTSYEQSEILSYYPNIYYVGENLPNAPYSKLAQKTSSDLMRTSLGTNSARSSNQGGGSSSQQQQQVYNGGFDDERGDYILNPYDHIAYRYEVLSILGKGSFGQVAKCIDHADPNKKEIALKIIRNKKRFHHQALVEVKILQKLKDQLYMESDPAPVVEMLSNFYFRNHLCITFDLLDINLYEFIKLHKFKGHSLRLIRHFGRQILASMRMLEHLNIVHCDLKPENILLCDGQIGVDSDDRQLESFEDGEIKGGKLQVIDFGSSCQVNEKIYTYIQSRFYRSPEVILGIEYGIAIDMWSFGCILAELYTGYPLFAGENEAEQLACMMEVLGFPPKELLGVSSSQLPGLNCTRRKVFFHSDLSPKLAPNSKGKVRKPCSLTLENAVKYTPGRVANVTTRTTAEGKDELFTNFSSKRAAEDKQEYVLFIDFLRKCLEWDPRKRWTAQQASQHPWITTEWGRSATVVQKPQVGGMLGGIGSFKNVISNIVPFGSSHSAQVSESSLRTMAGSFESAPDQQVGHVTLKNAATLDSSSPLAFSCKAQPPKPVNVAKARLNASSRSGRFSGGVQAQSVSEPVPNSGSYQASFERLASRGSASTSESFYDYAYHQPHPTPYSQYSSSIPKASGSQQSLNSLAGQQARKETGSLQNQMRIDLSHQSGSDQHHLRSSNTESSGSTVVASNDYFQGSRRDSDASYFSNPYHGSQSAAGTPFTAKFAKMSTDSSSDRFNPHNQTSQNCTPLSSNTAVNLGAVWNPNVHYRPYQAHTPSNLNPMSSYFPSGSSSGSGGGYAVGGMVASGGNGGQSNGKNSSPSAACMRRKPVPYGGPFAQQQQQRPVYTGKNKANSNWKDEEYGPVESSNVSSTGSNSFLKESFGKLFGLKKEKVQDRDESVGVSKNNVHF
ncbi:hypothetical protein MIR68_002270 [Amoeboaphelidium protococcarum]|nr:hypothetical protein MIR68_002270 [Amoeboaphelidium protococcarum]